MMKKVLALIASTLILGGCAATGETSNQDSKNEPKEYVTGSRIPRKDPSAVGVTVVGKEELERAVSGAPAPGSTTSSK